MKMQVIVQVDYNSDESLAGEDQMRIQDAVRAALFCYFAPTAEVCEPTTSDLPEITDIRADDESCLADKRRGLESDMELVETVCTSCGRTHCHCP